MTAPRNGPSVERLRDWGIHATADDAGSADDLVTAATAALAGGEAAVAFYESDDLAIEEKAGSGASGSSPVTRADHAANLAVLRALGSRTADPVLSEESDPPPERDGDRLWIVDPLDGTKEFIARNGEFSVMVGLAGGGRALLGAVYVPAALRLYLGHVELGAWVVDDPAGDAEARRLRVDERDDGPLRLIRSRSHPDPALQELEARIGPVEVVISGSVGIKCARIADGDADVYVHPVPYLKEWDTCAPEAVLRGAGGLVTDCAGGALRYGKADPMQRGGIFCGRPEVHERVSPLVREVARHLFTY